MNSSTTIAPSYPSLKKRGMGRFYEHNFKIPLCPPEAVKKSHCIRLPGENRGPDYLSPIEETGFRLEFTPYLIRGRNDVKQHQTDFFTPSPLEEGTITISLPFRGRGRVGVGLVIA